VVLRWSSGIRVTRCMRGYSAPIACAANPAAADKAIAYPRLANLSAPTMPPSNTASLSLSIVDGRSTEAPATLVSCLVLVFASSTRLKPKDCCRGRNRVEPPTVERLCYGKRVSDFLTVVTVCGVAALRVLTLHIRRNEVTDSDSRPVSVSKILTHSAFQQSTDSALTY
jgi:hypothetical protein